MRSGATSRARGNKHEVRAVYVPRLRRIEARESAREFADIKRAAMRGELDSTAADEVPNA